LKPEKTANIKKRKAESLLFLYLNQSIKLNTSSDEGEQQAYYFSSSKAYRSSKTILEKKTFHPTAKD
jgi:hypothetical protein